MLDPRKKPHIKIQPPFIRPDLSDRQITIKVSDNGIHSTIISSKVSCSQLLQSFSLLFPFYSNIHLTYIQTSFFCSGVFSCFIPIISCHNCITLCIPSNVPSFPFQYRLILKVACKKLEWLTKVRYIREICHC